MTPPLYSIVVPTRERHDVLASTLRTVANQTAPHFEVIVMDNFGGPETKQVVDALSDSRFSYHRAPKRLSMSENWEMGLSHATGDYVLFLGDDDGLVPDCIETASAIHARCPGIALGWNSALWYWPTVQPEELQGSLFASISPRLRMRSCREWLDRVLEYRTGYSILPGIYSSFVPRSVIEEVKSVDGHYFSNRIPDVWSSVVNSMVTDHYLFSCRPLGVRAVSHHSTGHAQLYHAAPRQSAQRFDEENKDRWSGKLDSRLLEGPLFEADMLIADTILKARDRYPDRHPDSQFSFKGFVESLARVSILRFHEVYEEAVQAIRTLAAKNQVKLDDSYFWSNNLARQVKAHAAAPFRVLDSDGTDVVHFNTEEKSVPDVETACFLVASLLTPKEELLALATWELEPASPADPVAVMQ